MSDYRDSYSKPKQVAKHFEQEEAYDRKSAHLASTPNGHLNCHRPGCGKVGRFAESTFSDYWQCAFHHFGDE